MRLRSLLPIAAVAGFGLILSGGCDRLTRSHFDMITTNVDAEMDVEKLLGPPNDKVQNQWVYERPEKHLHVLLDFNDNGVVTRKQWVDGSAEEWSDSSPPDPTIIRERTTIRKSDD
jgi:hypothetical protein